MAKVLIATVKPFSGAAASEIRSVLTKAGYEVHLLEKYPSQDDLIKAVKEVDALIIRSDIVDREVIQASENLKIVVRAGAGYDNIDLKAASEKNVVVMNTPGQNSNAVAELVFGMMVYLNRHRFNGSAGIELRGKTLGIHAYGYVGRIVGMIAKGFGMKVSAFDPYIDKVLIENDGVEYLSSAEELYRTNQYISLHLPANSETRESINYDLLNLMPKGATLVNTARKEVIHEPSLLRIFKMRDDFRYLSDIVPDCKEEIEKNFEGRYFFTPKKMGAQTAEANLNAGVAAARQIVDFLEKGDITFQVN
ncbi:MAG TPA: 3-phosphoglycerate dehydrogenase [Bacteroidaceae bacterium]|nr:3-phosphoglycerate dehydrogenase [Bacteroidaceae bacterium]